MTGLDTFLDPKILDVGAPKAKRSKKYDMYTTVYAGTGISQFLVDLGVEIASLDPNFQSQC